MGRAIPDGMSPDAAETWPPRELIDSFLGRFDLEPSADAGPVDQEAAREFRDLLGRFASGVTIVTAMTATGPVGMTCQSFSSVSLRPPLVLFAPSRTSRTWPQVQRTGRFCVNLLAADQEELSDRFARPGDKFADVAWTASPVTGAPRLVGTLGYVDCRVQAVHEAGDHVIVIGRVEELSAGAAEEPLVFYRGGYRRLG